MQHTRRVHGRFACDICTRSYGQAPSLSQHKKNEHSGDAAFKTCFTCDKVFSSDKALKVHNATFHDKKKK